MLARPLHSHTFLRTTETAKNVQHILCKNMYSVISENKVITIIIAIIIIITIIIMKIIIITIIIIIVIIIIIIIIIAEVT